MALVYGNSTAKELYYGGQKIAKVYVGNQQIFPRKQNWQNHRVFQNLVLVDGKLAFYEFPESSSSSITLPRITGYEDWLDIGLRSDGSLYRVVETSSGATVTQVGTEKGWSAIRGDTALRQGAVYNISTGEAVQTGGGYTDYTELLSSNYAVRADGCIYAVSSGKCLTPGISGGWSSFDDLSGYAVVLRNGVMYHTSGGTQEFTQYGSITTWQVASVGRTRTSSSNNKVVAGVYGNGILSYNNTSGWFPQFYMSHAVNYGRSFAIYEDNCLYFWDGVNYPVPQLQADVSRAPMMVATKDVPFFRNGDAYYGICPSGNTARLYKLTRIYIQ